MKFFAFSIPFLVLVASSAKNQCGQGKVTNINNLCIQPDYIEGCAVYKSKNVCSQCQQGFKLTESGCDAFQFGQRSKKILGCLQKTQDKNFCLNCANGWIRKNGECHKGVKNCLKYTPENRCSLCKPDYSLVLDQCKFNILLGCKKIGSDHTCQQCWFPYTLKESHCQVQNCQSLNDYGCVTCHCGFFLTGDRLCKKIDDGCLRYERGRCINCLNYYRLKGGKCLIEGCNQYQGNSCTQCKSLYQLKNGACQFKNCIDWANDQCYACEKGFKLEEGVCVKQIPFVCNE